MKNRSNNSDFSTIYNMPGNNSSEEVTVTATNGLRQISKDSIINLEHGDPTMFEQFWKKLEDEAKIKISGSENMSYFSDATQVCWFLEPKFDQEVRRLHKLVGNAVTENKHIVVGIGSTQLFQAAIYALSPSHASEAISIVSTVPYYSSYPTKTDFLGSGLFKWAGDAQKFKGDSYIEVVCSPNNPDGLLNNAVLNSKTGKTIHDLAYYWPQYTAITDSLDHDTMLFTVSKCTGHAGTRLGWAVVKDINVAKRMVKFIEMNTIGVSKDSQLRAAKIFEVISNSYEFDNTDFSERLFDYGRKVLSRRWEILREVIKENGSFTTPTYPMQICRFTGENFVTNPPFAWVKCEKKEIGKLYDFFKDMKVLTRAGKHFGVGDEYVRISMLDREESFKLFIERLVSLKN